jgi:hypothetical protein
MADPSRPPIYSASAARPKLGRRAVTPSRSRLWAPYLVVAAVLVVVLLVVVLGFAGVIPGWHLGVQSGNGGGTPVGKNFLVTFQESGLPAGTHWSVTLNGTTLGSFNLTLVFTEVNGSYPYQIAVVTGFTSTPTSGVIGVTGGPATVSVVFSAPPPPRYNVVFEQSGLPGGTSWSVTLGGGTRDASTSSISFSETNGTYPYAVASVRGYAPSPAVGNVTVNGATSPIAIDFAKLSSSYFSVVFEEGGLPQGTQWSVSLQGVVEDSVTSSATFNEPNGTYAYRAGSVAAYTPSPAAGNVTLVGRNTTVPIYYYNATNRVPLGTAFAIGNAVSSNCTALDRTDGICVTAGDQLFTLTVEASTIDLGNVLFELETPAGGTFHTSLAGGFSVETIVGDSEANYTVPAGAGLIMTVTWTDYAANANASTPLTTLLTIVVDTGIPIADWTPGQGDYLTGLGVGQYTGTVTASLP